MKKDLKKVYNSKNTISQKTVPFIITAVETKILQSE
jgi:hypothetical protein